MTNKSLIILKTSSSHIALLYLLFVVMLCLAPLRQYSQPDTLKDKTEIVDFYFGAGPTRFPVFTQSQNEFKKIAPASKILSGDIMNVNFNDFDQDSAGGFSRKGSNSGLYAQAGVTVRLKNKDFKKAGPWLKLGMNFFSSSSFLNTGIFRRSRSQADSLYIVGALPVNRAVSNTKSVTYEYSSKSLNFEATLVYKLNQEGVFSLFGGPGTFVGTNFDGKATLISTTEKTTKDYLTTSATEQILYKQDTQKSVIEENFSTKPNLAFGLFVNIGVDLRLGHKYDYIKNTHFFVEIKPMFRAYAISGGGLQGSTMLVSNVGLRYQFE